LGFGNPLACQHPTIEMRHRRSSHPVSAFEQQTSQDLWQNALQALPNAHALQSWTWGEFKSRWGWTSYPLLLTIPDNREIPQAAALLLKKRFPLLPFSILYVPRGPALDYNNASLRRLVLAELEGIARRENAIFIKLDPGVVRSWGLEPERPSPIGTKFVQELQQRGWRFSSEQIQFRNTVELALQRPEEELLKSMKQKTRYNIRLAARKGIVVRQGTPLDFQTIAEMYEETATRDGFAIRPSGYYLDIWQAFYDAGMAQPLLAEFEGEPVAAVILVRSGSRVTYMYGASTDRERKRMPNHLLQWEAIRWAREQGCEIYDFWGAPDEFVETDPLWGVWRFKAGFQGQVVRHIGAWDYVVRPLWYWLYTVAMPQYLDFLRSRAAH
jgi:lipid II:glycine glycyltransferase (peptidoglycan interpeptide bridge formation enzyme)